MKTQQEQLYRNLFQAADAYYDARPWERLAAELPVYVMNPVTKEYSIAVGMGGSGIVRGLAVYNGRAGQAAFKLTMDLAQDFDLRDRVPDYWTPFFLDSINLEFVDAADRTPTATERLAELGLRYRGALRHPLVGRYRHGYFAVEELTDDEIRHLTECVEAITYLAQLPYTELDRWYDVLDRGKKAVRLTRTAGGWRVDKFRPAAVSRYEMLPRPLVPGTLLPQPRGRRGDRPLAIALVPSAVPVDDPSDPPAYFPLVGVAVDMTDGRILDQLVFSPETLVEELGDWFAQVCRTHGPLQPLIHTPDEPTAHLLKEIAQHFGYQVKPDTEHDSLRGLTMHLYDSMASDMGRGGPEDALEAQMLQLMDEILGSTKGSPADMLNQLQQLMGQGGGNDLAALLGQGLGRSYGPSEPGQADPNALLQVRVDLAGAKPPIWRRLVVPATATLPEVHNILQIAFGWLGYHLHAFTDGYESYGPANPHDAFNDDIPYDDYQLGDFLTAKGDKLTYSYDFGDDWTHIIKLEKVLPKPNGKNTVHCTGGRRSAPPEDCGGIWGYENYLEALAAGRKHAYYADAVDALGKGFDAAAFSAEEVDEALRNL